MTDKTALYADLAQSLDGLIETASVGNAAAMATANAANAAALIYERLPELNWAGFYFLHGKELVVGPFQGRPACVRIPVGQGVCGTAVVRGASVLVPDVHEFPGHIACDAASRSELVVPIRRDGRIIGVLDLDSPRLARFDDADRTGCERLVEVMARGLGLGLGLGLA